MIFAALALGGLGCGAESLVEHPPVESAQLGIAASVVEEAVPVCQIADQSGLWRDAWADWQGAGSDVVGGSEGTSLLVIEVHGASDAPLVARIESWARFASLSVPLTSEMLDVPAGDSASLAVDVGPALSLHPAQGAWLTTVGARVTLVQADGSDGRTQLLDARFLRIPPGGSPAQVLDGPSAAAAYPRGRSDGAGARPVADPDGVDATWGYREAVPVAGPSVAAFDADR